MSQAAAPGDRSARERMLAGEPYIADDPELVAMAQRAHRLSYRYNAQCFADDPGAEATLRELLGKLGEGVEIRPPLFVDYGCHLFVGDRTFVNYRFTALDCAPIRIGADCLIGPNVQLLTPTHPVAAGPRRDKWEGARPISLGDNVWLGGGVIVCPGVTIGDDAVIGAGAVVTRDIPAGTVAVGNPARVVKEVPADAGQRAAPLARSGVVVPFDDAR